MKEKIKNFLLKIKEFFYKDCPFKLIELIVLFIILNVISTTLVYMEIMSNDYCFNETHTEQVEEIPQTESMRIDRDIKCANPTSSDYINPSVIYSTIYCNYTLSDTDLFTELLSFYYNNDSLFLNIDTDIYIYPLYCFIEYGKSSPYLLYILVHTNVTGARDYEINIITSDVSDFSPIGFYFGSFGNSDFSGVQISVPLNIYIPTSSTYSTITPLSSLPYNGIDVPIGSQNQQLFNVFSSIPFETSSTPTLENAPTELVNTIPSNAVTTLPSNLGTKVYDSGSNTYNNNNVFGYQLYYNNLSSFRFDNDSTLVNNLSVQFDNFYYQYTIEEIYFVLYGLWNNTQIYYISDNLVDVSRSFYTKDYENFNFTNTLNTTNTINSLYSDFSHIYVDVSLLMQSIYTVNNNTVDIASYSDYGFEFLLPSSINSFEYGNKSHDLDIVCELDRNFVELFNLSKNMTLNDIKSNTFNELYDSAFNSGSESGYNEGYDSGYDLGFSNGRLEGYETGYNEGFEIGTIDGYETGYIDGNNAGISSQAPFNPVMDFIADGALVISNVFSFEILPNLTLGTLLLFPLVISLIWFIIKLFMGG